MAAALGAVRPSLPRASPPNRITSSSCCCSRWAAPATTARSASFPSSRSCCHVTRPRRQSRGLHCKLRCSQAEVANSTVDDDEACELVRGTDLVIGQGDDEGVRAYLLEAVKNNNGTCVLLLSDIFGFEDSATRDFAYRIACHGYNVLVPDLFRGNPWKKSLPMDGFQAWLSGQAPERVAGDIETCRKWLIDDFLEAAASKKLGVVGFCYGGGRLVETLARDADGCFCAGVCFYGSRMDASLGERSRCRCCSSAATATRSAPWRRCGSWRGARGAPRPPCTLAGATGSRTGRSRWRTTATPRTRSR